MTERGGVKVTKQEQTNDSVPAAVMTARFDVLKKITCG